MCGITGDRVETPFQGAGGGVVGADKTPHPELRTAIADDHHALDHARCAGYRIGFVSRRGLHRPQPLSVFGIERFQTTVERSDEHLALPHCNAAIHRIAAQVYRPRSRHFGIVMPQHAATRGVEGVYLAPGAGDVHASIHHDRCCFHAAPGRKIEGPVDAELRDIAFVDLRERTEALLVIASAMAHPVEGLAVGRNYPRAIDIGDLLRRRGRARSS